MCSAQPDITLCADIFGDGVLRWDARKDGEAHEVEILFVHPPPFASAPKQ